MVEYQVSLNGIFHALSDPSRRQILDHLRDGEKPISELAAPLDMTLAGAAKHVQVLVDTGLVKRRKQGRSQMCRLNQNALKKAHKWLERYSKFWNSRLDNLEEILSKEAGKKHD